MFREMRRFKQQISEEECIRILKEEPRGVLSMIGDDGYPYGIPISHFYSEEDGKIYANPGSVSLPGRSRQRRYRGRGQDLSVSGRHDAR